MLVLRLAAPEKDYLNYALFSRNSPTTSWQSTDWEAVPAVLKQSRQIVVLIPSREVLIISITLKTKNQRQLAQALPFALEEQLMGDPEEQHYVWHTLNSEEGLHQVAIISRDRLQQWLDFLHHNGIAPLAILPDFAALPFTEGQHTVWLTEQGLWVRHSTFDGYYTSASAWPLQLKAWLMASTEENPIRLRVLPDIPLPTEPHLLTISYDTTEQTQVVQQADIQALVPAFNLAKGFKTQAHSQLSNLWKQWQGVAWAGALTALIALVLQGLEIRQLQQDASTLEAENITQFKTLFPQASEVDPALNLSSLINSELRKLQSGNKTTNTPLSALPLLTVLAQVLPQQPITLQTLVWNQNKLTVRFSSESTAVIPELERALTAALQKPVSINYQRDANKVVGEFILIAEPVV